jgi:hypothetical protein
MVRRGSTVRVRQRALQKRRKSALSRSRSTCSNANVRWVWSRVWSFQILIRCPAEVRAGRAPIAAEEAMTLGTSTVRPSARLGAVVERTERPDADEPARDESDGRLVGLLTLRDAEAALRPAQPPRPVEVGVDTRTGEAPAGRWRVSRLRAPRGVRGARCAASLTTTERPCSRRPARKRRRAKTSSRLRCHCPPPPSTRRCH